jgi:hypothetical protein
MKFNQRLEEKQSLHTSDDIAIANAIISNPASILSTFFAFITDINRLDRVNAIPAGSFPSYNEGQKLKYWVLVLSRSAQVFKNFSTTFVGGLIGSNI